MKNSPFKAAKSAFDIKKVLAGDIHLWMAIIAIVRLVLHWTGESVIDGDSEALTVWIVMAVWGIMGVVKGIRKPADTQSTSTVGVVLLLALLSMSAGCSQSSMATVKKGFLRCGVQCMRTCLAEQAFKQVMDPNAGPIVIEESPEDD